MNETRTVQPQYLPITLAQARAQCRVDADNTAEDSLFTGVWIPAVVDACEQILRRSIMLQTWRLALDEWADEISLPWPKVQTVSAVEYKDVSGNWQTLDAAYYEVDSDAKPGRLVRAAGYSWPSLYYGLSVVRVTYTAGYAAGNEAAQQAAVPAAVKQWLLLAVGTAYAQRESLAAGVNFMELPGRTFDGLLDRERLWSY